MGIFSKKENEGLFHLLDADAQKESQSEKENRSDENKITPSHALTADEVQLHTLTPQKTSHTLSGESPLESLKKRMMGMAGGRTSGVFSENAKASLDNASNAAADDKQDSQSSLLQKCKVYMVDEQGHDARTPKEPLYRLETVAEILENDSRKTMDRLSQKYGIMIDDLGGKASAEPQKKQTVEKSQPVANNNTVQQTENEISEDISEDIPVVSAVPDSVGEKPEEKPSPADDLTAIFKPVNNFSETKDSKKPVSITKTINLTNELGDLFVPEQAPKKPKLEDTDFDDFTVDSDEDVSNPQNAKRLIHKLSIKKRNSFLCMVGTIFLTVVLLCFEIPYLSDLMLSRTGIMMGVCTAILCIAAAINADMFISLSKVFSKNSTADVAASFAAIFGLIYGVFAAVMSQDGYEICILTTVVLAFRSVARFMENSTLLSNLKLVCAGGQKKSVALIMDEATTFAMAKDAIDGDVLIAAPRLANNITNFMKYSQFGNFINGKLPYITVVSLVLAIISGFAASAVFSGFIYGIYAAAAVMCIAAMPVLFLIEAMPLFDSARKLNRKGAVISGKTAAERLEMANAVVLTSADLFPSGTVTLHNMKVLSDNPVDDTILKAASLTAAVDSPLSIIFKQIAGTNSSYSIPDSDTVKYEERLGISGWVDDELLFIGNRTLMESHGIEVPDVRIDKKILQRGFFPVYIASGNVAVALVVVQYSANEEVALELKKITDSGVTLLVNNCDPNITSEMVCDYLGLYSDSVQIMSNAGVHMYKSAVEPQDYCSAPAIFKGKGINYISVINSAAKIRKSKALLYVLYVLIACLGVVTFAYLSFSGADAPLAPRTLMLAELGATLVSLLVYWAFKP